MIDVSSPPLVSVLMPAHNVVAYVDAAVASVLAQSYPHWELLIADDGSTDGTGERLAAYRDPRIRVLNNSTNMGYVRTCNRLFQEQRGALITFQDADDICDPERLDAQVAAILAGQAQVCGTWAHVIDTRGKVKGEDRRPTSHEEIFEVSERRNPFCGATIMVTAAAVREVGTYRDYFGSYSGEDYDWACRLVERFRATNLPRKLYSYRQRPGSMSKTPSVTRAIGHEIVARLAKERRRTGSDALMRGDDASLRALVDELRRPYDADAGLLHREWAGATLALGMGRAAIRHSLRAIAADPGRILNYRTLGYCVRRHLMGGRAPS